MQAVHERAAGDGAPEEGRGTGLSLSLRAYDRLRRAIVTHDLAPGERVSESSLVNQFGLSKAAVRSGMARLSSEGFIVAPSQKVQVIAPLTMEEVRSVFQMRNLLEPHAALAAAGKVDPKLLEQLDLACGVGYTPGDHDQEYAFLETNKNFHMAIAEASGNALQTSFIERLQDAAMRILWVSLKIEDRPAIWQHGHEEIIDALVKGEGDRAAQCALDHLKAGQHLVYEVLASSSAFQTTMITPFK